MHVVKPRQQREDGSDGEGQVDQTALSRSIPKAIGVNHIDSFCEEVYRCIYDRAYKGDGCDNGLCEEESGGSCQTFSHKVLQRGGILFYKRTEVWLRPDWFVGAFVENQASSSALPAFVLFGHLPHSDLQ